MAKIYSGSSQYVPPSTIKNLHSGPGKVHVLIATASVMGTSWVTLYDALTNDNNKGLFVVYPSYYEPVILKWGPTFPLVFTEGLTVSTGPGCWAFVIVDQSSL